MSTYTTSRRTRGQHVSPRDCLVYRPSPARREHINGRVQGLPDSSPALQRYVRAFCIAVAVFAIVWIGGRELLAVVS